MTSGKSGADSGYGSASGSGSGSGYSKSSKDPYTHQGGGGGIPQPTLPQMDLDDDVLRAKRKADRAGIDVPTKQRGKGVGRAGASSPLDFDDGIYPGRESSSFTLGVIPWPIRPGSFGMTGNEADLVAPPVAASYKNQNQYPPRLDYDQPYSQGSYRSDEFSR